MWRQPTFLEIVLIVVVVALITHSIMVNKELDRINTVLMFDSMSNTTMTTNMVEQAKINDLLIERLFNVEHAIYTVR